MEKTRDGFKSGTGFVIACIGSAVGMGNIWRFPYMGRNDFFDSLCFVCNFDRFNWTY